MKRPLVSLLVIVMLLLVQPSSAQSSGKATNLSDAVAQIEALKTEMALLRARVQELEDRLREREGRGPSDAQVDSTSGEADAPIPPAEANRLMVVEEVEVEAPDHTFTEQALQFRSQAAKKLQEGDALEKERIPLLGCNHHPHAYPHCGCVNKDVYKRSCDERRRKRDALSALALKARQEARRLNGEAKRAETERDTPRHIIRGWNGSNRVLLRTTRDCTKAITQMGDGATITWAGDKVGFDGEVETWEVTRLEVVPKATLQPRGTGIDG